MNPSSATLPLRDIHLPEAISWWPPAPGWWILLLLICVLAVIVWRLIKRHQKKRRLRDSLYALAEIRASHERHHNNAQLLRELSVLLRRACITFYPRKMTASLTGPQWLAFLDASYPGNEFAHGGGQSLATAPYLPENANIEIDAAALLNLCEAWLRAQPYKAAALATRADTTVAEVKP